MAVVTCTSLSLSASSVLSPVINSKPVMRNVMPKLEGTLKTKPVSPDVPEEKTDTPVVNVTDEAPAGVSAVPGPQELVTPEKAESVEPDSAEKGEETLAAQEAEPEQEPAPANKAVKKAAKASTKSKKK